MINLNKRFNIKSIFILSILSIYFLVILFFYLNMHNQNEDNILQFIQKLIVESGKNVDVDIENKFNLLDTIAYNISDQDLSNPQKLAKSFNEIAKKNKLKRMAIITPDGTAYCSEGDIANVSDREYFNASMNGYRYVSNMFYSKIDGKRTNAFTIPIYRDNNVVAVLYLSILTNDFYEGFNLGIMKDLGDTFIINNDGDIIVSDKNSSFNLGNFNIFDELESKGIKISDKNFKYNNKGYVKLNFPDGDESLFYYSKINYYNWWAVSLIDTKTIDEYCNYIIQNMIIITILIALFISIIFIIRVNKEKRKLKNLKDIAYRDNITEGNNDIYLRNNISKIINKKDKFAFISLEIINIENMISVSGLKNVKFILREIYTYLNNMLNEGEFVIHSYLGEYKLLMKYINIDELTKRLEEINFSRVNDNIKFIMGIYLVDDLDASYEDMCSYVRIAKEFLNNYNNNTNYMIYNKEIHKKEINKLRLEEDIKVGIENKEFKAWYQPKYDKDGKTIIGAEALVRWHKYESIITPNVFVPLCESNGLIKEIDELIFEDVCKNIRQWIDNKKNVVPICINLSRSYIDKTNFIDNLEKYMEIYKISSDLIHFEITESSLMGNENKLKDIVSMLHDKGFQVSVDDFGVGYSSIKAISYVEFDALKIDKSFVDGIGEEKWESIIKYTANLAKKLGMVVVVEGIETEEQYKFLVECNCDMFQGYYFSKPMNANDFSNLI